MFRIRRVYDDVTPTNKAPLTTISGICITKAKTITRISSGAALLEKGVSRTPITSVMTTGTAGTATE
jgi:hypothetical protein